MNVAEYIIQFLEKEVLLKNIYTLTGGGCIFISEALRKSNIKEVFCYHEQAASIAAEAEGQLNGLGVCLVTTGPGGTNCITGVAAAYLESTPMIILSGQVSTQHSKDRVIGLRQYGFQEVDITNIVEPITKYCVKVQNANSIKYILEKAIHEATTLRKGPVWIDIPLDIQTTEVDIKQLQSFIPPLQKNIQENGNIAQIIKNLLKSKRPAILIGNGARCKQLQKVIDNILDLIHIPVLTTWKTFDIFTEQNPLNFGRPGKLASRYANNIQQKCDFFLSVGARLDLGQTAFNNKNYAKNAKCKYIIDIDQAEIQKLNMPNMTGIVCDGFDFLVSLLDYLNLNHIHYHNNKWLEWCNEQKKKYKLINDTKSMNKLSYYDFLEKISNAITSNHIVVAGSSGTVSECTCQALKINHYGTRFINTNALGSMGFALPASIGSYYASISPDYPNGRPIICLEGDGSFVMNIQELSIVAKHRLPISIFIINNGGYISIQNTQKNLFNNNSYGSNALDLFFPDFKGIAKAYGIPYCKITAENVLPCVNSYVINDNSGPILYEVMCSLVHKSVPCTKTIRMSDGTLTSSDLGELYT